MLDFVSWHFTTVEFLPLYPFFNSPTTRSVVMIIIVDSARQLSGDMVKAFEDKQITGFRALVHNYLRQYGADKRQQYAVKYN